jgi:transcriptional regulator with XRE-family HTH domain
MFMALGSERRKARVAAGLTLAEVAQKVNLTLGHLSLLERGLANPSIGALDRICEAIGVRMSTFF